MRFAKKLIAALAAMAMSATALTSMISASALEGAGTYTGSAAYIGTYYKADYFGNTAFEVSYKYDKFDEDGTYVDPDTNEVVTIDYNDTLEFLVFDSEWGGWDKTPVGPGGIDVTEEDPEAPPLTADDLNTTDIHTAVVPIAIIESELSTTNAVQGINLQLGGVGDTTVTIESIEYVQGEVPGEEVTIKGEWKKLTDYPYQPVGEMKVIQGSAYVFTTNWNIQVSQFSTSGFVNPTVAVTVTYDKAPNDYIQAELLKTDWTPIVANYPYVDVTGTYTYTTEIPAGTNAFIACYDQCTVKEIHIYNNHEGNALKVSGIGACAINSSLQPGFALGGALDALDENGDASETAWGNPVVTEALFQTVKGAGFKSVRIPVSYLNMIDDNGDVNDIYLNRIQKVVDDALDTGLYVVMSMAHDGSASIPGKWIDISLDHDSAAFAKVVAKFSAAWKEIAAKFANYNEALIFEDMCEVMISGKYSLSDFRGDELANAYANINELNQAFVDAVRGTGTNDGNDDRCLIVPGYNTNIDITAYGFDNELFYMPSDTVNDRLMLRVGYFAPSDFTLSDNGTTVWDIYGTYGYNYMVSQLTKIAGYGYPIFVGEYSAIFKNNIPEVVEYVGAFNKAIKEVVEKTGESISAEYWDNGVIGVDAKGSGIIDRRFNIVTTIGDSIINAINGYNEPIPPEPVTDVILIENAGPFTGDATPISTYYRSLYSNKSKLEITFEYSVLYSMRTDSNGEKVAVDFNDTFEFEAFNTTLSERKILKVGPNGVNGKTYITPDFNRKYTVTVPIANIESMLSGTPYGIMLKTGNIGNSEVSIVSLKLID